MEGLKPIKAESRTAAVLARLAKFISAINNAALTKFILSHHQLMRIDDCGIKAALVRWSSPVTDWEERDAQTLRVIAEGANAFHRRSSGDRQHCF
jgi:hypothetical protein